MLSFSLHTHRRADLLLPYTGHIVFTTVAGSRLVGGAVALSGCTATFNRLAFVDQGSCELVGALQRHMSSAGVPGVMMAGG
jgi:hypothetical protein